MKIDTALYNNEKRHELEGGASSRPPLGIDRRNTISEGGV